MGGRRDGVRSVLSDDKSIEVMLMDDRWSPIVIFTGRGNSFASRCENNVAWMLQTLLGSGSKVDTLYENCWNEYNAWKEVKEKLGSSSSSSAAVVRIAGRSQRWQNVKAAAVGGKRSHIFALILALGLNGGWDKAFKQELDKYGLAKGMCDLLQRIENLQKSCCSSFDSTKGQGKRSCSPESTRISKMDGSKKQRKRERSNRSTAKKLRKTETSSRSRPARSPSRWRGDSRQSSPSTGDEKSNKAKSEESYHSCEGINLKIVCESVPVIALSGESRFSSGSVSWLLRSVLAQDSETSDLVEYIKDIGKHPLLTSVHKECKELGLSDDDIKIAKVPDLPFTEVLGVGTSGETSAQLAVAVAIALRDEGHLEDVRDIFPRRHPELEKPFYDLVEQAVVTKENPKDRDDKGDEAINSDAKEKADNSDGNEYEVVNSDAKEKANDSDDDEDEADYMQENQDLDADDDNGDITKEVTWDPYMAAEEDVWNRPSKARQRKERSRSRLPG